MSSDASLADQVRTLLGDVLEVDPSELPDDVTAEGLAGWDSMNHMRLITMVEEEFDIHFAMSEVWTVLSLEALVAAVESKR